jgi:ferritin-like metal-binding protein YciE
MNLKSLRELLVDQLQDIYSAEGQLTKALPKLAKAASSETLVRALKDHLEETNRQITRLDRIAAALGVDLSGKKCKAMQGLIKEGAEAMKCSDDERLVDAAIIAGSQRVEHYEVSAYGTAAAIAEQLDLDEVVNLLRENEQEEIAGDEKLTKIVEEEIYPSLQLQEADRTTGAGARSLDEALTDEVAVSMDEESGVRRQTAKTM